MVRTHSAYWRLLDVEWALKSDLKVFDVESSDNKMMDGRVEWKYMQC